MGNGNITKDLLKCPSCLVCYPFFQIYQNNKEIIISFHCSCNEYIPQRMPINDYFATFNIVNKSNLKCIQSKCIMHSNKSSIQITKSFEGFCAECVLKGDSNIPYYTIEEILAIEDEFEKHTKDFNDKIELMTNTIKLLFESKEDNDKIMKLYNNHQKTNNQLILLIRYMFKVIKENFNFPNYIFITNLFNLLHYNTKSFKHVETLSAYIDCLEKNYIITFAPIIYHSSFKSIDNKSFSHLYEIKNNIFFIYQYSDFTFQCLEIDKTKKIRRNEKNTIMIVDNIVDMCKIDEDKYAYFTQSSCEIKIFDNNANKIVKIINCPFSSKRYSYKTYLTCIALKNKILYLGNESGKIAIYNIKTYQYITICELHNDQIFKIIILKNGNLITSSFDLTVLLLDPITLKVLKRLQKSIIGYKYFAFLNDDSIAVNTGINSIGIYNSSFTEEITKFETKTKKNINDIFPLNKRKGLIVCNRCNYEIWDLNVINCIYIFNQPYSFQCLSSLRYGESNILVYSEKKINLLSENDIN